MDFAQCNPFIRNAMHQALILEGSTLRCAYDHRLFFITSGHGTLLLKEQSVPLAPYSALILNPGVPYGFSGTMGAFVVNYDLSNTSAGQKEPRCPVSTDCFDPAEIFDPKTLDENPPFMVQSNAVSLLESIQTLVGEFSGGEPFAAEAASAQMKLILIEFQRILVPHSRKETLCDEIDSYIRMNLKTVNNKEISAHFAYHEVYLSALYKSVRGINLHKKIENERIRFASELLTKTDYSIGLIAEQLGFATRSHFCSAFKRCTGVTPNIFRNSAQH